MNRNLFAAVGAITCFLGCVSKACTIALLFLFCYALALVIGWVA